MFLAADGRIALRAGWYSQRITFGDGGRRRGFCNQAPHALAAIVAFDRGTHAAWRKASHVVTSLRCLDTIVRKVCQIGAVRDPHRCDRFAERFKAGRNEVDDNIKHAALPFLKD